MNKNKLVKLDREGIGWDYAKQFDNSEFMHGLGFGFGSIFVDFSHKFRF